MWIEAVFRAPIDSGADRWLGLTDPSRVIFTDDPSAVVQTINAAEDAARASGGYAVGFITYEAGAAFGLSTHSPLNGLPLVWFALFESRTVRSGSEPFADQPSGRYRIDDLQPSIDREQFTAAFTHIRERLAAGDSYQANFTFQLSGRFDGDERGLFADLVAAQQGRHAVYLDIGTHVFCSASPELFFERTGDAIRSRPMKGTVRRGRTGEEDAELRGSLLESAKQRAENVMIVDMVRNDLGRVAEIGSVDVTALFIPERYPTVWQMTSEVRARSTVPLGEIFAALHPCASITGAPKASTMRILKSLERGPRGVYTGALGWIGPDGSSHFSVAIRTAVVDRGSNTLSFGVGSGIVWDSEAGSEYEECLLKAAVLEVRPSTFELLETLRWDPGGGFFVLDRHLARLKSSAGYFDFAYDERLVRDALEAEVSGDRRLRIRLLLGRDGGVRVEQTEWRRAVEPALVGLAATAINPNEVFLFHKTTNRAVYDERRRADVDETILWNASGEVTEATTANVVVRLDGEMITPPLTAGLLAGTFRAELLARHEVREGTVHLDDLQRAEKLWLINSVQEWREARLVD